MEGRHQSLCSLATRAEETSWSCPACALLRYWHSPVVLLLNLPSCWSIYRPSPSKRATCKWSFVINYPLAKKKCSPIIGIRYKYVFPAFIMCQRGLFSVLQCYGCFASSAGSLIYGLACFRCPCSTRSSKSVQVVRRTLILAFAGPRPVFQLK